DRQQRRRDGGAERRGAVPDPGGQSAVSHVPPVAHDTRCAGKHRCLAGAKEDAGDDELPEAPDQTNRRLCKRPDKQAETQKPARTKAIGHCPARKLAESVSPEERRKQKPHIRDRQAKLLTDQRIGDGERSTVDIVERSGDHEKYKGRSLPPPDAGWNRGVGHDRTSSKALTSPPTAACGSTASGALPGHPQMGGSGDTSPDAEWIQQGSTPGS